MKLGGLIQKMRTVLLPPESPQELFLRTLYHRANATPFFVNRRINSAAASYKAYKQWQSNRTLLAERQPGSTPGVIFLMEVSGGKERAALDTIRSLQAATSENWKIAPILLNGVDWNSIVSQVKNNSCLLNPLVFHEISIDQLNSSNAEFVVFCRAGDVFHPELPYEFSRALEKSPAAEVIYTDYEYVKPDSGEVVPFFKPAALSPELMLSINYLSRGFVRLSALHGLPSEYSELMCMEYDLDLRLVQRGAATHHIPGVLVSIADLYPASSDSLQNVLKAHLERQGMPGVVAQEQEARARLTWEIDSPGASLIILSHNNGQWLRDLVNSIFTITDYPDYSLTIVDNRSTEGELLEFYEELKSNAKVKLVHYDEPFNYSRAINIGVENAAGEVVVLLNNDMLITDSNWLRELVQWAVHPEIGVVGGKLLHRNLSIQHAGIILGMNGILGHLYLNAPEHFHGLAGSVGWYRNFYALTGACQAIRRELFHQVGGYDERFRLAFGDIDFCLRVVKAGYRNLYNPFVRLIHFEGGSRGYDTPAKDIQLGYAELMPWLEQDDPYFSPSLTYEPIPQCVLSEDGLNARLINIENRRKSISSYFEANPEL